MKFLELQTNKNTTYGHMFKCLKKRIELLSDFNNLTHLTMSLWSITLKNFCGGDDDNLLRTLDVNFSTFCFIVLCTKCDSNYELSSVKYFFVYLCTTFSLIVL